MFGIAGQMTLADETRTSCTIVLQDLDEYIGTYRGHCQDSLKFTVQFDNCLITFFIDEFENLGWLVEELNQIPVGRKIGILVIREGSQRRIILRLVV